MTKLCQWIFGVSLYASVWFGLIYKNENSAFVNGTWYPLIAYSPLIVIVLFGLSCLMIVFWRVYNFNDCPEAAKELQQQIKRIKEELKEKGLEI